MQVISETAKGILDQGSLLGLRISVETASDLTMVNVVQNGDLSSGTTGWYSYGQTLTAADNVLTVVGPGNMVLAGLTQLFPVTPGKKIFVKCQVMAVSSNITAIETYVTSDMVSQLVESTVPVQNTWYTISESIVMNEDASGNGYLAFQCNRSDANPITLKIKYCLMASLTDTFGAGLEQSDEAVQTWLAKYSPVTGWFSGTAKYGVVLNYSDLIEGSFSIDRNSISGRNVEIGNAETTEVSFEIDNHDRYFDSVQFEGALLVIDEIIGNETLRLGKFIVDEIPSKVAIMSIRALDYMAKFNKAYTGALNGQTLITLLNAVCTSCGVTLYTQSFLNSTLTVATVADVSDITCHQIVAWVAELAGANAWIDWNGELRLTWYGENQGSTVIPITSADRFSYDLDENDVSITGVIHRTADTDTVAGTQNYALVIENNQLLAADDVSAVLTSIYNKIGGFTYRPFKFATIGKPNLWPMDELTITTVKSSALVPSEGLFPSETLYPSDVTNITVTSYVMNHRYKLNGRSTIAARGDSVVKTGYASSAPFTARQKTVMEKVVDIRAGVKITALDQAMMQLNELAANAQGYYQTTVSAEDGSRIDYLHNSPLLAMSTTVYKRSIDGFFWTDAYDGEATIWTSGYTADGNIVAKTLSVVGINANWITAGEISSIGGESYISLENGRFGFGWNGTEYALSWDGSKLEGNGTFITKGSTQQAQMDDGSFRLVNSGVDMAYLSIQTATPTGPFLSVAAAGYTIDFAKLVGTTLYHGYQIDWGNVNGTTATHRFYGDEIVEGNITVNGSYVQSPKFQLNPDPGGGSGDTGSIHWSSYGGEDMALVIEVTNDAADKILLQAPSSTNGVLINGYAAWHDGNTGTVIKTSNIQIRTGQVTLNSASWTGVSFNAGMSGTPRVALIANTSNSGSIVGKVRNVSSTGFEGVIGGTGTTSVFDYIAIWGYV